MKGGLGPCETRFQTPSRAHQAWRKVKEAGGSLEDCEGSPYREEAGVKWI